MGSSQGKAGRRVMVEVPLQPTVRTVAGDAIGSKPAAMECILMTLLAQHGRSLEVGALVASSASNRLVAPNQRKARHVVIEIARLFPSRLVVA